MFAAGPQPFFFPRRMRRPSHALRREVCASCAPSSSSRAIQRRHIPVPATWAVIQIALTTPHAQPPPPRCAFSTTCGGQLGGTRLSGRRRRERVLACAGKLAASQGAVVVRRSSPASGSGRRTGPYMLPEFSGIGRASPQLLGDPSRRQKGERTAVDSPADTPPPETDSALWARPFAAAPAVLSCRDCRLLFVNAFRHGRRGTLLRCVYIRTRSRQSALLFFEAATADFLRVLT